MLPFLAALAPFAGLIGGAVNAVGTFLSAGQAAEAAKQPQKSSIDFKQLVTDARAAGFNPLTVLRSGGAAGYAQTHAPALSSISPLGEGLQAIGGAVSAFQWDPLAGRRAQVEFGIAQETLHGLQLDNRAKRVTFDVPSYQGASSKKAGPWKIAEPEPVAAIRGRNLQLVPDLGTSNAQEFEDRYGDVLSWMYGVGVFGVDVVNTVNHHAKQWGADIGKRSVSMEAERDAYRQKGVMAPMGAPASLRW